MALFVLFFSPCPRFYLYRRAHTHTQNVLTAVVSGVLGANNQNPEQVTLMAKQASEVYSF